MLYSLFVLHVEREKNPGDEEIRFGCAKEPVTTCQVSELQDSGILNGFNDTSSMHIRPDFVHLLDYVTRLSKNCKGLETCQQESL